MKLAIAVLLGLAATASFAAYDWFTVLPPGTMTRAKYVGRQTCASCHQTEHKLWLGSDHDLAMDLATDATVLADFNDTSFTRHGVTTRFFRRDGKFMVNAEGPDGELHDYEIKYTFGVRPLQQYMVEFPDGRVQVLRVSWDTRKKEWFEVTPPDVLDERILPGDPLHWTGIAQNWNTTCADCHSTNLHKNYDVANNTYHTSFEEIDVSCEECHGPGSVHVEMAQRWSPFWDRNIGYGLPVLKAKETNTQLEMCAKCHARRYQVHEDFRPGQPLLDFYEPSLLSETLYHSDGEILDEVYEYGSFLQSRMHANHVRCTDCHDPHSLKLKFVGNALCTQCHLPAKYDTEAHHHHHHQGSEVGGERSELGGRRSEVGSLGEESDLRPPTSDLSPPLCIQCHMPSRLYMVIDERRDHSFRVPRPDLTVQLGTPNACNDCHTKPEETAQWAADAIVKWYGPKRPEGLPLWAPAIDAGRQGKPEGEQMLLDLVEQKATPAIVRATAIDLLANYPGNRSNQAVYDALHDLDPLVRVTAVRRLSDDNTERLVSELSSFLDDPVRAVRIAAASRLVDWPRDRLTDKQRKSFEQAMKELQESQELSLDHAGAHLVLGARARRAGKMADAVDHLRTAIKLEPYLTGARAELASLMQAEIERLQAEKAEVSHLSEQEAEIRRLRTDEADLLDRDAKLAPNSALIFWQLGNMRYLIGELDAAQSAYQAAVDLAPTNFEFLMMLALLHEKRYDLSSDEEQFNAAVAAIRKLNELQQDDPRTRSIAIKLIEARRKKQGGVSNSPPEPLPR
ncbi:MAG: HEAT repeat domain-containing protein [Pirellulales bacterium]